MPFHTRNTWTNNLAQTDSLRKYEKQKIPEIYVQWWNTNWISSFSFRKDGIHVQADWKIVQCFFVRFHSNCRPPSELKMANTLLLIGRFSPIPGWPTVKHILSSSSTYFAKQGWISEYFPFDSTFDEFVHLRRQWRAFGVASWDFHSNTEGHCRIDSLF